MNEVLLLWALAPSYSLTGRRLRPELRIQVPKYRRSGSVVKRFFMDSRLALVLCVHSPVAALRMSSSVMGPWGLRPYRRT